jgi:hypothetical protein
MAKLIKTKTGVVLVKKHGVTGVVLELSLEEAQTLRTILSAIGGCPRKSLRYYCEKITSVLDQAGIGYYPSEKHNGWITFEDQDIDKLVN